MWWEEEEEVDLNCISVSPDHIQQNIPEITYTLIFSHSLVSIQSAFKQDRNSMFALQVMFKFIYLVSVAFIQLFFYKFKWKKILG